MYCRNCGNELLETDKFCEKCGNPISIKSTIVTDNRNDCIKETINNQHKNLPINWLNFWKYIRFPLGIILSVANVGLYLPKLEVNLVTIFALLIDILVICFMCITYYHFLMQNKIGYSFLITWLIIELVFNSVNASVSFVSNFEYETLLDFAFGFLLAIGFLGLIWTLPNYIYFKKRKYYFFNDNSDE